MQAPGQEADFIINSIKMTDFESGEEFWQSDDIQKYFQVSAKSEGVVNNGNENGNQSIQQQQENNEDGNNEQVSNDITNISIEANIPASILECKAVAREISFTSKSELKKLRLEQCVYLNEQEVEFFDFYFGFVIPESTNTWQSVLESQQGNMIPKEVLSGNLVVQTKFYDDKRLLSTANIRIFIFEQRSYKKYLILL